MSPAIRMTRANDPKLDAAWATWTPDNINRWFKDSGSSNTMCGVNSVDTVTGGHAGCMDCTRITRELAEEAAHTTERTTE